MYSPQLPNTLSTRIASTPWYTWVFMALVFILTGVVIYYIIYA